MIQDTCTQVHCVDQTFMCLLKCFFFYVSLSPLVEQFYWFNSILQPQGGRKTPLMELIKFAVSVMWTLSP